MKVTVIRAKDLSQVELSAWSSLQTQNPDLRSPYFSPGFTQAVARVRDDVRIGVIEDANKTVAFFPFQRHSRSTGRPIGWPLSDYHGLIAPSNMPFPIKEIVGHCGLKIFDYDHLLQSQVAFQPFHTRVKASPFVDLTQGFDRYVEERARAGSKVMNSRMSTKRRKLDRESGGLQFVLRDTSQQAFDSLLTWKSDQYRRTNAFDLFQLDWVVRLLDELRTLQEDSFAGLLSTLYAGDKLVAAHLGMRSSSEWHYWFPTYDRSYHSQSPGYILIVEMLQVAQSLGLKTIDLGSGENSYKAKLATGENKVAVGFVGPPSFHTLRCSLWRSLGHGLNQLPEQAPFELLRRAYRRTGSWYQVPE